MIWKPFATGAISVLESPQASHVVNGCYISRPDGIPVPSDSQWPNCWQHNLRLEVLILHLFSTMSPWALRCGAPVRAKANSELKKILLLRCHRLVGTSREAQSVYSCLLRVYHSVRICIRSNKAVPAYLFLPRDRYGSALRTRCRRTAARLWVGSKSI